jgi:hypothetical protein
MKIFKGRVLNKIERLVYISQYPRDRGLAAIITQPQTIFGDYKVYFPLFVDNDSTVDLSVRSIKCMFRYKGVAMQNLLWEKGDSFASNGTKVNVEDIKSLKEGVIGCEFNPFPYMPVLPQLNIGWGIKEIIEFQCFFGTFKKEFNFKEISIVSSKDKPTGDWSIFRVKYQQFYSSIFAKTTLEEVKK